MFYFIEYVIGWFVSSCQWKPLLSLCNIICDIKISGHDYFLRPGGDIKDKNELNCWPSCVWIGRHQFWVGSVLEVTLQMARQCLQVGLAEPLPLHTALLLPLLLLQIYIQRLRPGMTEWQIFSFHPHINIHFRQEKFEQVSVHCQRFADLIPVTFVLGFYVRCVGEGGVVRSAQCECCSIVITRWWGQYKIIPWPDSCCLFISTCILGHDDR